MYVNDRLLATVCRLNCQDLFEQSIQEDLAMIDIKFDKVVHTSDHFEKIQVFTEKLIQQGDAFMDDTDGETVRRELLCPGRSEQY